MEGVIKKVVKDKHFGFIRGRDGKEYFFHSSGIKNARWDDVDEGRDVTFEDAEGTKGPRAEDIYIS